MKVGKRYVKWFPTVKQAQATQSRIKRTHPRSVATLWDGFVAGYKSGYVVSSRVKIKGWKVRNIR